MLLGLSLFIFAYLFINKFNDDNYNPYNIKDDEVFLDEDDIKNSDEYEYQDEDNDDWLYY